MFVGEPSVEDTISILRGIKEKYETHHGVRITDVRCRWCPRQRCPIATSPTGSCPTSSNPDLIDEALETACAWTGGF